MMMMKSSIILTACILFLLSIAVEASQNSFGPEECCFEFFSSPLPKRKVTSYKYTEKMCPKQGVLFTMMSGRVFCANPNVQWVKNVIQFRDAQAAKTSSPLSQTTN